MIKELAFDDNTRKLSDVEEAKIKYYDSTKFFSLQVTDYWNGLLHDIIMSQSVDIFTKKIDTRRATTLPNFPYLLQVSVCIIFQPGWKLDQMSLI